MTMTLDPNHQRFGPLNLGPMSSYQNHPQFSNPWASAAAPQPPAQGQSLPQPTTSASSLFAQHSQGSNVLPNLSLGSLAKPTPHDTRPGAPSGVSHAPYASMPVPAASAGSPHASDTYRQQQDLLSMPQDLLHLGRLAHPTTSAGYGSTVYTTAPSPVSATYPPSSTGFDHLGYAAASGRPGFGMPELDSSRRYVPPPADDRKSFQDALEASQGMLSMSQETPRNIYDVRQRQQRGSADSYGFPSSHSNASSISSGTFSGYYPGSVDGNVSDYSTAGSDMESLSSRTALPRLQPPVPPPPPPHHHHHQPHHQQPPAPQSMMSSFSSKVSSSTQKKHKCKVCDKRFTRPSSLQTHMYSHTGEKPFACQVPGCGRQFSVVSNLRRHKKVHKGMDDMEDAASQDAETPSETGSEDHHSCSE